MGLSDNSNSDSFTDIKYYEEVFSSLAEISAYFQTNCNQEFVPL